MQQTRFSITQIFVLTLVVASLLAVPRLSLEMPEFYVIAAIILHQVCLASVLGFVVWFALGKRKFIGFLLVAMIGAFWLPYSIDIVERTIWGDLTTVHQATETLGLTEEFGAIWFNLCSVLNYEWRIAKG